MILEQCGHLSAGPDLPGSNHRVIITVERLQRAVASDPDRSVAGGENPIHLPDIQSLIGSKAGDAHVAEQIEPRGGRNPQVTFLILVEVMYEVSRQAIGAAEVLHFAISNPIDALRINADPQRTLSIQKERRDL